MLSKHRSIAAGFSVLPLCAWVLVALQYAFYGEGGGYPDFTVDFVILAVVLTVANLVLVVQAWRGKLSAVAPIVLAVLATPAILFVEVIIGSRY